jgi:hypothetical protein
MFLHRCRQGSVYGVAIASMPESIDLMHRAKGGLE